MHLTDTAPITLSNTIGQIVVKLTKCNNYPKTNLNSDGNQSTNIINTNNHLSPNNHLSFLLNTKKPTTYDVGNPGLDFGQVQICGGVKPVNE
jgi:hypothetical protein